MRDTTAEHRRLAEDEARAQNWKRWGPYLSERQWATVREDYSAEGDSWNHFPHDHARSRAYRWGEDGLLGFTDRECRLCFALALWNGRDTILKERLFGLTGPQGNHGEDVKEAYFYLASTPTHSYAKALYKYPQRRFPYEKLVTENRQRGLLDTELELSDTGLFDRNEYFDVFAEYAKAGPNDLYVRLTAVNQASHPAELTLLPTLWFRNAWSWGCTHDGCSVRPRLWQGTPGCIDTWHDTLGNFTLTFGPELESLFTDNETNTQRLFGTPNPTPYVKDAFHRRIVNGESAAVNPAQTGTKAAVVFHRTLEAGQSIQLDLRLCATPLLPHAAAPDNVFDLRRRELTEYYDSLDAACSPERREILEQAAAGLFWTKQFYHYVVDAWLAGDPDQPAPPGSRWEGRNKNWTTLFARDILSMPDKWEYPWFAVWDLAFHMVPFAKLDPAFAKDQLQLLLREWYMHPNGQLPAYEFDFSDVNPPVHAWAAWRVYKITGDPGQRDYAFLESTFHKLLLNFTWWVNRKDTEGNNIFAGGFLGLDNIGVFDRSKPLPTGGHLQQADGTAWMGFYCLTMLSIAIELAQQNSVYEDMASKFFEHFVTMCDSINRVGGAGLWDEEDGFYYDRLKVGTNSVPLKTRSLVGLLPIIAVAVIDSVDLKSLPGFRKRMDWFLNHRPDLARLITFREEQGRRLAMLAMPSKEKLRRIFGYLFDEAEFLCPFGVRSLSRVHETKPYSYYLNGHDYRVNYVPGESDSHSFGGNSNWRGPVWFPTNYLLVEALERYHYFFGDAFTVEYPTGSGQQRTLKEIAVDLGARLISLFTPNPMGARPCHGQDGRFATDPAWRDLILFYEYFHADTGRGCGASHQTGWTALVLNLLLEREPESPVKALMGVNGATAGINTLDTVTAPAAGLSPRGVGNPRAAGDAAEC
ncbi:MAG TPA: hypothetical protein VGD78_21205 [Chthoniobacterales bacterium]